MAETKMLTANDLAEKAGLTPVELRKLLRKEFNRAGKVKVEGNRMEYRFAPNDPIVKQIIQKTKAQIAGKPKDAKTKNQPKFDETETIERGATDELTKKGGESDDKHPDS
jgi:hypothetical protein